MAHQVFPTLFKPFTLGRVALKNRFALAPMTRSRAGTSLIPNDNIHAYYKQFDSTGLVITEGVHISPQARGWVDVPGIWTQEQVEHWKPITKSVRANGCAFFVQLWHMGRQSHSSFHGGKLPVSASPIAMTGMQQGTADYKKAEPEVPHALTVEEIKQVVADFVKAAENAIAAGFDGVELHGANGYLLDQFLQSSSNQRTDEYGGSVEKRFRFVGEVLDAVIAAIGADRVGIRFGPNGMYGGMGSPDFREQFTYAIRECGKRNIAYVHVMDGLAFGFHKLGEPFTLKEARAVLPKGVALIGNCGYTPETAEAAISSGDADLIAFGRPYLSNPDLPERVANGWPMAEPLAHQFYYTPNPAYSTTEGYVMPKYSVKA